MKRAQFSLLLMLLIVTLAATITAWRLAVHNLERVNVVPQQINLDTDLQLLEKAKAELSGDELKQLGPQLDARIEETRKELERLQRQ